MAFISIVVPCFDESEVIETTIGRLCAFCDSEAEHDFEIIFVDDGSRDDTADRVASFARRDERIKLVRLARNFGHQVAVSAGIDAAAGAAVVIIDADLQDPPEVIHEMIASWRAGFEVVYGVRSERAGESGFKKRTAAAFYRILNRISEIPLPLDVGDFRLMDAKVVEVLKAMPERHRFIRGMVSWIGFRQVGIPYKREARWAGATKYPLQKMIGFASDGIISFSTVPLKLATHLGFLCSGLALAGIAYALLLRLFTSIWVPGWTLLFIAVTFFGGVQLVSIGIIGEYVGRMFMESKRRPLYVVRERVGFDAGRRSEALSSLP